MINFIGGLFSMLIVAFLFTKIRGFIFKRAKSDIPKMVGSELSKLSKIMDVSKAKQIFEQLKKKFPNMSTQEIEKDVDKALEAVRFNCTVGKSYKKDKGAFSFKKFKDNFTITKEEGKKWGKTLGWWINWRNWVVIGIIIAAAVAYGYSRGQGDTPITVNLDYNKEFKMKLDGHYLVKPKNSQNIRIEDEEGNIIKDIKAKDFPLLAKKLKPVGFILEPIGVIGYGAGTKSGMEYGAGVSFIKYWKWKLDGFLTQRGVYLGTSYQITDNTGVGLGVGKGYTGDNRIIFYGGIRF